MQFETPSDEGFEAMSAEEQMDMVLGKDMGEGNDNGDDCSPLKADGVDKEIQEYQSEEIHRMTMLALGLAVGSEAQDSVDEFVEGAAPLTHQELQQCGAADDGDVSDDAGLGASASEKPNPKRASFGRGRGRGRGRASEKLSPKRASFGRGREIGRAHV